MVTSVTSLMKTITSVEDEAGRSQRALETALEAIQQCLVEFESKHPSHKRASPEDMLHCSKELTKATARTARAVLPGDFLSLLSLPLSYQNTIRIQFLLCLQSVLSNCPLRIPLPNGGQLERT